MRALIQDRLCPCCGAACAVAARPAAPAEADSLKAQIACLDSPPAYRSEQVRLGFADSKGSTFLIGLASFNLFFVADLDNFIISHQEEVVTRATKFRFTAYPPIELSFG